MASHTAVWDALADAMCEHRPAPRLAAAALDDAHRADRAADNQQHVRQLLRARQPGFAASLDAALSLIEAFPEYLPLAVARRGGAAR